MDIKTVRDNVNALKENQIRRFKDPNIVDKIMELDKIAMDNEYTISQCNRIKNLISKEFVSRGNIGKRVMERSFFNDLLDNLIKMKKNWKGCLTIHIYLFLAILQKGSKIAKMIV